MILKCAVYISIRKSPDRSVHRLFTQKATWFLSCFVLSTKKIPAASPWGVTPIVIAWSQISIVEWHVSHKIPMPQKSTSSLIITLGPLQKCLHI